MTSTGTLVVGASQAGVQLATALRQLGDERPITLVGSEPQPPYQRPPLSKTYLSGAHQAESLAFRSPDWYAQQRIDLRVATTIERIELDGRQPGSGIARTAVGEQLVFDRLALTVGGRPTRLDVPGADLPGVCYLRDLADADLFRQRLDTARRVVVIGGGFIGLEAAASATAAGKEVTVVDVADRLLGRAVAPVVSDFFLAAHRRRGTQVLLSIGVGAVEGHSQVTGVRLDDGRALPADLVLVGVGMEPRTELAEQIGLALDDGIVVDGAARTSVDGVVAAGDCTSLPHPSGHGRLRIESVQNAVSQAQAAAASLLGHDERPRQVPWFWSDQADLKLQIAGLSVGHDQYVLRGDPDREAFSVLYYLESRLVAGDAVNSPRDYMLVRKLLGQGATIPPELAGDTEVPLKDAARALFPTAGK